MPGVKGRSGAPGIPKTEQHKAAISKGIKEFWLSEEGQALKLEMREAANLRRLATRERKAREARQ